MNRKQRDKNRVTALALHYACAKWSAQEAWRAKLYSPRVRTKPSKLPDGWFWFGPRGSSRPKRYGAQ